MWCSVRRNFTRAKGSGAGSFLKGRAHPRLSLWQSHLTDLTAEHREAERLRQDGKHDCSSHSHDPHAISFNCDWKMVWKSLAVRVHIVRMHRVVSQGTTPCFSSQQASLNQLNYFSLSKYFPISLQTSIVVFVRSRHTYSTCTCIYIYICTLSRMAAWLG